MAEQVQERHAIWHTPFRDLIRGRITGRLDWRGKLATAGLPVEATLVIARVVGRTRLWRLEKAAVADELAGHFIDALATGRSVEAVVNDFGDERVAAKLIRRAKIRNRSFLWHGWKWCRRGTAVFVLAYGTAGIVFFASSPKISVDYLAVMNRSAMAAAPDERAWPLYREAIRALKLDDRHSEWNAVFSDYADKPPGANDAKLAAWIDRHSQAIDLIREAATRPEFGFIIEEDGTAKGQSTVPIAGKVVECSVQYLAEMRSMAQLLHGDARIAAQRGDRARCMADLRGLLNMPNQLGGPNRVLVDNLVSVGLRMLSYIAIAEVLQNQPGILSDVDLASLSATLSRPRTPSDLLSVAGEQVLFDDLLQRVYSDNGHGDGHFTASGLNALAKRGSVDATDAGGANAIGLLFGPGAMLMMPSRADLSAAYRQIVSDVKANLEQPTYTPFTPDPTLGGRVHGQIGKLRYALVDSIQPSLGRLSESGQRCLGIRDGTWCGIALEQYRRHIGNYPEALEALVPAYLPTLPVDRITGGPLHYRLLDGKPIVYSVGGDRKDDGGRLPIVKGVTDPWAAVYWDHRTNGPAGDWVIFGETPKKP